MMFGVYWVIDRRMKLQEETGKRPILACFETDTENENR
jgi:hypothetical protein